MELGDETLFQNALIALYAMCPFNVAVLLFISAPYGKHVRSGWGPSLPPAVAWFLMESPTLWLSLLLYPLGRHRYHPLSVAVVSLYLLHYIHRTIIYPLRLLALAAPVPAKKKAPATTKQGFPLVIALMAFSFSVLNAYVQSRSASEYAEYSTSTSTSTSTWWVSARVAMGMGLFFWGMAVNISSDLALLRLRAEGGGYKIPRGGWFEAVSCPNYMGEMAEWLGWAVVAWSPAALGFFLYTCSNIGPRAMAHHRWYREKFGSKYPESRKAVVPFIC